MLLLLPDYSGQLQVEAGLSAVDKVDDWFYSVHAMFIRRTSGRIWIYALLFTAGIAAIFYFVLGKGSMFATTGQLNQERTLSRAEASNLTAFFQNFGNSVALLAQADSMPSWDKSTITDMNNFVEQWRGTGIIGGVLLTNKNGKVILNSNVTGTPDLGGSLSDRDYFTWAKTQASPGQYFAGKAVISRVGGSRGQAVIVVASPVFINGSFNGVIAASVELKPLIERYLGMMKVSGQTNVYLIGKEGDLLYNRPSPDDIGGNIFDLSETEPFLGSQPLTNDLKNAINATGGGQMILGNNLIAYSAVQLGNRNLLVVISSPAQEVKAETAPVYIRQISILILIYFSIILFGEIVIRHTGHSR